MIRTLPPTPTVSISQMVLTGGWVPSSSARPAISERAGPIALPIINSNYSTTHFFLTPLVSEFFLSTPIALNQHQTLLPLKTEFPRYLRVHGIRVHFWNTVCFRTQCNVMCAVQK
jgi:hypothetical protein